MQESCLGACKGAQGRGPWMARVTSESELIKLAYDPADLRLPPWLLRLLDWVVRLELPLPRGGRIGVTRPGALYVGALTGVWAAALYSGNNLLYLCGAMLFALAAVALWQGYRLLNSLPPVAGALPPYIEAGRRQILQGELPDSDARGAQVELQWYGEEGVLNGQLRLAAKSELLGHFVAGKRGVVHLQRQQLETAFPLGLWRIKKSCMEQAELLVMPQAIAWDDSVGQQRRFEHGDEWHGLREYVPGDALSHVHWRKAGAAGGRWSVKRFDRADPFEEEGMLRVDLRLPAAFGEHHFDQLLGKAWFWLRERENFSGDSLVLGSRIFELDDAKGWQAAIEAIARAVPEQGEPVGSGGICLSLVEETGG